MKLTSKEKEHIVVRGPEFDIELIENYRDGGSSSTVGIIAHDMGDIFDCVRLLYNDPECFIEFLDMLAHSESRPFKNGTTVWY